MGGWVSSMGTPLRLGRLWKEKDLLPMCGARGVGRGGRVGGWANGGAAAGVLVEEEEEEEVPLRRRRQEEGRRERREGILLCFFRVVVVVEEEEEEEGRGYGGMGGAAEDGMSRSEYVFLMGNWGCRGGWVGG